MDIGGSQIVSGSGAYLIHGGMENARHALLHTSRSSPATVCHDLQLALLLGLQSGQIRHSLELVFGVCVCVFPVPGLSM